MADGDAQMRIWWWLFPIRCDAGCAPAGGLRPTEVCRFVRCMPILCTRFSTARGEFWCGVCARDQFSHDSFSLELLWVQPRVAQPSCTLVRTCLGWLARLLDLVEWSVKNWGGLSGRSYIDLPGHAPALSCMPQPPCSVWNFFCSNLMHICNNRGPCDQVYSGILVGRLLVCRTQAQSFESSCWASRQLPGTLRYTLVLSSCFTRTFTNTIVSCRDSYWLTWLPLQL